MTRSAGFKFFIVGLLALLMFIPLFFVSSIVDERADYSRGTISDVSDEWGGEQLFSGPQLVIPVTEQVTSRKRLEIIDPETGQPKRDADDRVLYEYVEETVTEDRPPVFIYPNDFKAMLSTKSQERTRGIFVVPVYVADVSMQFDFPADAASGAVDGKEEIHWDKAELRLFLSANKALRGEAHLTGGNAGFALEPLPRSDDQHSGVFAIIGDTRSIKNYEMTLVISGAQSLSVAATGRQSDVTMQSDWPHPSFFGNFLPDDSDVGNDGFSANWAIPHLARALPQVSRENPDQSARWSASFGVKFFQPNDFYRKSYRAARYGILFISLTFLTVLLLDRSGAKPTHPVQYIFIGLAQSIFVLLMVSYAEQIGFGGAYLLASVATIGLLSMFGALALKLGRRTLVLSISLIVLYAVLYLILRSADYALLAGATLAFLALAATMFLTRNENWYGPEREPGERRGLFGRKGQPGEKPAPPA